MIFPAWRWRYGITTLPPPTRRKEQVINADVISHRDHGLHLHAYLPAGTGTPRPVRKHLSRARHLRRHGRVYLHVHQPEDCGAWLRQHGMIRPSSRISPRRATSVHQGSQRAADSATAHEIGPYSVVSPKRRWTASWAISPTLPRNLWRWNPQRPFASPTWRKRYRSWPAAADADVGQICKALGAGAPFRGVRFGQEHPIPELKDAIFQQLYMQVICL